MSDVLGGYPWSKQREILESLRDGPRVSVRSCHGVGKTWTAAAAGLWFLLTRPNSILLTTAPTWRQVAELLWREMRAVHVRSRLPGDISQTKLELGPQWFALGLSTDEPDRFQGFHAEDILLICDEAAGIPPSIYDAAEGVLTTEGAKQLLIGNPTNTSGHFYDTHHGRAAGNWKQIKISAFDAPAYTGEDVPETVLKRLTSRSWVEARREEWGETSGTYRSRVLGEFSREEGLVYPEWDPARHLRETWLPDPANRHYLSIDIGWNNPTSIGFYEIDSEGNVGRYDEVYESRREPRQHLSVVADLIRFYRLDPRRLDVLMDPSAWNTTVDGRRPPREEWVRQARELGLDWFQPRKANNELLAGILRVRRYLRAGKIRVAQHCRWIQWEIDHYAWPKVRGPVAQEEKPAPEKPVDKDNHGLDELRYLIAELPDPIPEPPDDRFDPYSQHPRRKPPPARDYV